MGRNPGASKLLVLQCFLKIEYWSFKKQGIRKIPLFTIANYYYSHCCWMLSCLRPLRPFLTDLHNSWAEWLRSEHLPLFWSWGNRGSETLTSLPKKEQDSDGATENLYHALVPGCFLGSFHSLGFSRASRDWNDHFLCSFAFSGFLSGKPGPSAVPKADVCPPVSTHAEVTSLPLAD